MSFRKTKFDPVFTISQILIVQSGFYLTQTALILVADLLLGFQISLDHLLDWNTINYHTFFGWVFFFIGLLNAIAW